MKPDVFHQEPHQLCVVEADRRGTIPASSRDQNRSDPARQRQLEALLVQVLHEVVDPGKVLVHADVTGLLSDQTARSTSKISESRWSRSAKVLTQRAERKRQEKGSNLKQKKRFFFILNCKRLDIETY